MKVVAVKDSSNGIPKSALRRKELVKEGRIQTVEMDRNMSPSLVKNVIIRAFKDKQIKSFRFLEGNQSGKLSLSEKQDPNGDDIVDRVVKRKSSVYIEEVVVDREEVSILRLKCLNINLYKYKH